MKTKNKNSFVKICLIQFVLCSFLLLGLFVFANSISTKQLENSFPILDDFLIYEDYLKEERYDLIPIEQFSNCEFAIVNQKGFIYLQQIGILKRIFLGSRSTILVIIILMSIIMF